MSLIEEKYKNEKEVLEKFLSVSTKSSDGIFEIFGSLPNAQVYQGKHKQQRFVYIPGSRDDKVLLVAHADTVWDNSYMPELLPTPQTLGYKNGKYFNTNQKSLCGIGADDRAGCAILYLLRNSGHSILILDGEEHGQIGANYLKNEHPEIFEEVNKHCYALQFDRKNSSDYKFYNINITSDFKQFIENSYKYNFAGTSSKTDIAVLCKDMCGVNLSVGYYGAHTEQERIYFDQWLKTYLKTEKLLEKKQNYYTTQKPIVYETPHELVL